MNHFVMKKSPYTIEGFWYRDAEARSTNEGFRYREAEATLHGSGLSVSRRGSATPWIRAFGIAKRKRYSLDQGFRYREAEASDRALGFLHREAGGRASPLLWGYLATAKAIAVTLGDA